MEQEIVQLNKQLDHFRPKQTKTALLTSIHSIGMGPGSKAVLDNLQKSSQVKGISIRNNSIEIQKRIDYLEDTLDDQEPLERISLLKLIEDDKELLELMYRLEEDDLHHIERVQELDLEINKIKSSYSNTLKTYTKKINQLDENQR